MDHLKARAMAWCFVLREPEEEPYSLVSQARMSLAQALLRLEIKKIGLTVAPRVACLDGRPLKVAVVSF